MPQYINGVEQFLYFAIANKSIKGRIKYLYHTCLLRFWFTRKELYDHLLLNQFSLNYTKRIWHKEPIISEISNSEPHVNKSYPSQPSEDLILNMINDVLRLSPHHVVEPSIS